MSKTIQVPTRDQVTPAAQAIFDQLQKGFGFVPNLFATIGYSANALGAYLAFNGAQSKGTFNAKEREAIFLAVSEANHCPYCLAAHTALGKMNGFSDDELLQIRVGEHTDLKIRTLTQLAISITENRGQASTKTLDAFFDLGYGEAALMDLIALVADKTFTNYVFSNTRVPVDFPTVPTLEAAHLSN